jgi:hypothetical protein
MIGTEEIDLDDPPPGGRIALHERADRLDDAGIVDQDVDIPQPLAGFLDHRLNRSVICDVTCHRRGSAAAGDDFLGEPRRPRSIARREHDRRARLGENECRSSAYPATCAGHDRYLTGKLSHQRASFFGERISQRGGRPYGHLRERWRTIWVAF